jgi:L-serine dehydratase
MAAGLPPQGPLMTTSVFELFKPGIGPSSSHTMGPMSAAGRFLVLLAERAELPRVARITVTLYASLALTGRGHASDRAVVLGLMGRTPSTADPDEDEVALAALARSHRLQLAYGGPDIGFDPEHDIVWTGRSRLPQHPNGLTFAAFDKDGSQLASRSYFSTGGGFVRDEDEMGSNSGVAPAVAAPYSFESAAELLAAAADADLTIAELMSANEAAVLSHQDVDARLDGLFVAMEACIDRGLRLEGELPGGLKVKRRAKQLLAAITARMALGHADPLAALDFVSLWALAVNEENAAGGRVVTAPTNGAAGIIPAVLRFYCRFHEGDAKGVRTFLLTAGAIGALYKRNASISGAEVGCQGEVGVACSMAAAGLAAALGGSNAQIENAAEIGMEHNLGLTCDPIGGLVQIPCIERNAMGAIKAIEAARLALLAEGEHHVSLDRVIATMKRTGADMNEIYKETSLGGLAVSAVEC